jgi:hypothetical protein
LRTCASHVDCGGVQGGSSSSSSSSSFGGGGGGGGGSLSVVVGGWLCDPVVAAAMIEAAAPEAVALMLKATLSASSGAAQSAAAPHGSGGGRGKGACTGSFEPRASGAAARAVQGARSALTLMARIEPLLETYQLVEVALSPPHPSPLLSPPHPSPLLSVPFTDDSSCAVGSASRSRSCWWRCLWCRAWLSWAALGWCSTGVRCGGSRMTWRSRRQHFRGSRSKHNGKGVTGGGARVMGAGSLLCAG